MRWSSDEAMKEAGAKVQTCEGGTCTRECPVGEEKTDMRTVSKSGWAGHGGIGRLQEEGC